MNNENILPGQWTVEVQLFQSTSCIDGNNSESNTKKSGTAIFQKDGQVQFVIENEHNHYNWAVNYLNDAPFYCQSNNITLWRTTDSTSYLFSKTFCLSVNERDRQVWNWSYSIANNCEYFDSTVVFLDRIK